MMTFDDDESEVADSSQTSTVLKPAQLVTAMYCQDSHEDR